jgi:high-affinity nickel-transport protein
MITIATPPVPLRRAITGIYALLIPANIAAWAWALALFHDKPVLLGTALLAYSFGLRHAVDADHIAAIDNVTRKLMQDGQRPVAVGLFFALGHSTVVILAVAAVAVGSAALADSYQGWKDVGELVGTSVSALFLFGIAAANVVILLDVWRSFQQVRLGRPDPALSTAATGPMARLFRPVLRMVGKSWHMVPLGFLFGLGFETATEVTLLGISATQAGQGASVWTIMVFPALFAAGMTLVDTTDGVLMLGAYEWAYVKPLRKLWYNLTITAVSVVVAVLIGGIEALGLIGSRLGFEGGFWDTIGGINDNFNLLGFAIIGLFVVAWAASMLAYRYSGLDDIDITTKPAA